MENNESTQSKYDAALAKYNTNLNDAEVAAEVAGIIAEKVPANNTPEVKKFLFNCIDLTTLNSTEIHRCIFYFQDFSRRNRYLINRYIEIGVDGKDIIQNSR